MTRENEVSTPGILIAALFAFLGTVGYYLTHDRLPVIVDYVWLASYVAALLILSASVVNFDLRRLIK